MFKFLYLICCICRYIAELCYIFWAITTDATASPITWTESDNVIIPVSLGLENGAEFTAVSTGGGQRSWAA